MTKTIVITGLFLCLCCTAQWASAATLQAEWTDQRHLAGVIDGTRLYQDSASVAPVAEVSGVAVSTAEFPMPTDGKCHNYFLRNYTGSIESENSNIYLWCPQQSDPPPAIQPPVTVGGFKIITTVEPIK
jgi:hypothetical protein